MSIVEKILTFLFERAANNGSLESVLNTFLIISIEIIVAVIVFCKIMKTIKSKFAEYSVEKEEEDKKCEILMQNTNDIIELRADMNDSLTRIEKAIENLADNDIKQNLIIQDQLAHTITDTCNRVLERDPGYIKASELQTILRLFKSYSSPPINGNSYVHILVKKCTKLPMSNDGTEGYMSEYTYIKDALDQMFDD